MSIFWKRFHKNVKVSMVLMSGDGILRENAARQVYVIIAFSTFANLYLLQMDGPFKIDLCDLIVTSISNFTASCLFNTLLSTSALHHSQRVEDKKDIVRTAEFPSTMSSWISVGQLQCRQHNFNLGITTYFNVNFSFCLLQPSCFNQVKLLQPSFNQNKITKLISLKQKDGQLSRNKKRCCHLSWKMRTESLTTWQCRASTESSNKTKTNKMWADWKVHVKREDAESVTINISKHQRSKEELATEAPPYGRKYL